MTGVAGNRRVQPRVAGCRPEPAAGPGLAQRVRGMWPAPPRRRVLPGRGTRGSRPGLRGRVQRRARHQPGQRRLQLIGIQVIAEPVQRRRRRRHPPPGHRADPAAVPGQHLLAPARGGLRNRQRAAVPAGNPRHQHRYQRRQPVPHTLRPALVPQPRRHRIREHQLSPVRAAGHPGGIQVAADDIDQR